MCCTICQILSLVKIFVPLYNTSMLPEEKVAQIFIKRNKTLSIAESCSGGLLSNRITNIPGSSGFFRLGIVVYSDKAKTKLLGIPQNTITKYGAVSAQVAVLMAKNVKNILKTDFGIGITGIAGPTGASRNKPIGLVFVALSTKHETLCQQLNLRGARISIKKQTTTKALQLLLKNIV